MSERPWGSGTIEQRGPNKYLIRWFGHLPRVWGHVPARQSLIN